MKMKLAEDCFCNGPFVWFNQTFRTSDSLDSLRTARHSRQVVTCEPQVMKSVQTLTSCNHVESWISQCGSSLFFLPTTMTNSCVSWRIFPPASMNSLLPPSANGLRRTASSLDEWSPPCPSLPQQMASSLPQWTAFSLNKWAWWMGSLNKRPPPDEWPPPNEWSPPVCLLLPSMNSLHPLNSLLLPSTNGLPPPLTNGLPPPLTNSLPPPSMNGLPPPSMNGFPPLTDSLLPPSMNGLSQQTASSWWMASSQQTVSSCVPPPALDKWSPPSEWPPPAFNDWSPPSLNEQSSCSLDEQSPPSMNGFPPSTDASSLPQWMVSLPRQMASSLPQWTVIRVVWGWMWKCTKHKTRIKCLRKNPKHLTLTL